MGLLSFIQYLDLWTFSLEEFDLIKSKYGHYASWAVWAEEGEKPKDNIGNMDILNPVINSNLLKTINPNVVIVGLNISGKIKTSLGNFHSPDPRSMDFKMRYAFKGTNLWGAYMTDIIKDFEQKISGAISYQYFLELFGLLTR